MNQKKMLLDWLPRKPIKLTLLLNSNIDGDSTTTFMNKCKGKCPTLAVIKTTKGIYLEVILLNYGKKEK